MATNVIELILRTIDDSSGTIGKVSRALGGFGSVVKTVGAILGAGKVFQFLKEGFESADRLSDAAKRAGVAIDTFSRLAYVADQADLEFGEFTQGIKFFQKSLSDFVAGGTGPATDALQYLGVSAKELIGVPLDKQLAIIADRFKLIKDPADRTRTAIDLFSRSGTALIPLLSDGSEGIKKFADEADRLGITMDQRTAKAVDKFDEALKRASNTWEGFKRRVFGGLALTFLGTGDPLTDLQLQAEQLNARINAIYKSAGSGGSAIGAGRLSEGAKKELAELDKQLVETERQIAKLEEQGKKSDDKGLLGPRKKERAEYKAFWAEVNPQLIMAVDNAGTFLTEMQEARDATADAGARAQREWEMFNASIQKAGLSAQEVAVRTKEKLDDMLQEIDVNDIKKLRLAEPLTEAEKNVRRFTDAFKDGLQNAADQGKFSVKELVRYIIAQLVRQEIFRAIDAIGAALNRALSAKSGSSSGSFVSTAFNFARSIFGFAGGGRTPAYGLSMAGENGPELVGGGNKVWNAQQLRAALGGGSGRMVYSPVNNVTVNAGTNASAEQIANLVDLRIRQANQKQQLDMVRLFERNGFGVLR